jgi:hypothetical protein
MNLTQITEQLEYCLRNAEEILKTEKLQNIYSITPDISSFQYTEWVSLALSAITAYSEINDTYLKEFLRLKDRNILSYSYILKNMVGIIKSALQEIRIFPRDKIIKDDLSNIFDRFHKVVRQLRHRYNNRSTIEVVDEYDVQDVIHILLCLFFDDIRTEEWTPSYAGSSARMDFLLKKENIVIETKMTREKLREKEVGNQLIEDIGRYKAHANCKELICFVYDPNGYIGNPQGLENDLKKDENGFRVIVFIRPN